MQPEVLRYRFNSQRIILAMETTELNKLSLSMIKDIFSSSTPINAKELCGIYHAEFIGPRWLRLSAGPFLSLAGLHGWWGKVFLEDYQANNLIETASGMKRKFLMQVRMAQSPFDEKQSVQLTYRREAPMPWRFVTDELRRFDEKRILAMTYINRGQIYNLAFPFMLTQQESIP